MRVTAKGQVTIPQEVRERAGIMPGCEVEFVFDGDKLIVVKREGSSRGAEWVRMATGKGTVKLTTDEIMAMTRGED